MSRPEQHTTLFSRILNTFSTNTRFNASADKSSSVRYEDHNLPDPTDMRAVEESISFINNHHVPGMIWDLEEMYGLSYEEAIALQDNPFSRLGFDNRENRLGWTLPHLEELVHHPDNYLDQVLKEAETIRANFKYIIFSGMGSSGLCVKTLKNLYGEPDDLKIFTLKTTDPKCISDILEEIVKAEGGNLKVALQHTLVIISSKSGNTPETLSHQTYFEKLFANCDLAAQDHFLFVTDPGTKVEKAAQLKNYAVKYIQLNGKTDIGGRFTAPTTRLFLLPLALVAPNKLHNVIKTAREMNDRYREDTFIILGVTIYFWAAKLGRDKLTLIVPEQYRNFALWAEHLFEESLGKEGKGVTVVFDEDLAISDLRPVEENDRIFIRINHEGIRTSYNFVNDLKTLGYPVYDIKLDSQDCIGGLMLGLQRTIATIGFLWDINFVNQPEVEYQKRKNQEFLGLLHNNSVQIPRDWSYGGNKEVKVYYTPFIKAGVTTKEELDCQLKLLGENYSNAAAVYAALIIISRNKGINAPFYGAEVSEVATYGQMNKPVRKLLQNARTQIFTQSLNIASKLVEAPNHNHAYMQNLFQGKPMFLSTHILPLECDQPQPLAFDNRELKSQALSTVQSLLSIGRKVILVTVDRKLSDAQPTLDWFFTEVRKYVKANLNNPLNSFHS